MREIKVQCDCGQKFKFDVEPINGRMPYTVACPICGADGTQKANAILASLAATAPPPPQVSAPSPAPLSTPGGGRVLTAPTMVSSRQAPAAPVTAAPVQIPSAPAPAPVTSPLVPVTPATAAPPPPPPIVSMAAAPAPAPVAQETPPPASAERPRLRISSSGHSAPAAAPAAVAQPAPVPRKMPTTVRAPSGPLKENSGFTAAFARGVLGAFAGAFIGGAIYYAIMGYSGFRIGLMASEQGSWPGWERGSSEKKAATNWE